MGYLEQLLETNHFAPKEEDHERINLSRYPQILDRDAYVHFPIRYVDGQPGCDCELHIQAGFDEHAVFGEFLGDLVGYLQTKNGISLPIYEQRVVSYPQAVPAYLTERLRSVHEFLG